MTTITTTDLTPAFIKHYEAEVHAAYQRMGSKLRNTVRSRDNIRGSTAVFQKAGKGTATTKNSGAQVTPMQRDRTSVEIPLTNYYAGDWVDALDDLNTSGDEKMIVAQTGAYALGRKTDDLILDSIVSTTIKNTLSYDTRQGITLENILQGFQKLGEADVPDDGERYAIVGWQEWSELLALKEFANADYVGEDKLPWNGTQAKYWLGTYWMAQSGLPTTTEGSKNYRYAFWYHRNAIGHAVGKDITSDITWHGDYASYFINNMMSQGAGVIDESGIIKFKGEVKASA